MVPSPQALLTDLKLYIVQYSYDSMHFLVWRESDKSLTLLAKDYEPCEVFAAGLISRGGKFICLQWP
jgi:cleavage and polyadenylation specificity factor subunit 1